MCDQYLADELQELPDPRPRVDPISRITSCQMYLYRQYSEVSSVCGRFAVTHGPPGAASFGPKGRRYQPVIRPLIPLVRFFHAAVAT